MILSIVITAHKEGMILDRTLRSVFECIKEAENIKCDLLINVDKGDDKTRSVAEKYSARDDIRINYSNYGDVGIVRNKAIKKAKGKYVMLIDGDDIISPNWIVEGMKTLFDAPCGAVVHPESEVRFDNDKIQSCIIRKAYDNQWHETLALIGGNRWCSVVMGKKKDLKKCHYSKNGDGFGYEDYYFNCCLTEAGIKHLIVKNTVVFCLQKDESISTKTHSNKETLPYTPLFNLRKIQEKMKLFGLPKLLSEDRDRCVPKIVEKEMRRLSRTEDALKTVFENGLNGAEVGFGCSEDFVTGEKFCRMIAEVNLRFLPNTLDFTESNEEEKKRRLVVKTWRVRVSERKNDKTIDDSVEIDFNKYFGGVSASVRDEMIGRLIFQVRPRRIMVDESVVVWVREHAKALRKYRISILQRGDML